MSYTIKVNGTARTVDADGDTPLLWVLRDLLDMKGTKFGCGLALVRLLHRAPGRLADPRLCDPARAPSATREVTTIEGIGDTRHRQEGAGGLARPGCDAVRLLPGRADHVRHGAAESEAASRPIQDIDDAMSGNICRCATYTRIRAAIKQAAGLPTADTREV